MAWSTEKGGKKSPRNLSMKSLHKDMKSKEEVVAPLVKCLLCLLALNLCLFFDRRALSWACVFLCLSTEPLEQFSPEMAQSFSPNHICIGKWSLSKYNMLWAHTSIRRGRRRGRMAALGIFSLFWVVPDWIDVTRGRRFFSTSSAPIAFHLVDWSWREC